MVNQFEMGKGAAKYGFKSGILPTARSILKNPTVKQKSLIDKVGTPKSKGVDGVGYADNIAHPKGSHRFSPEVKFVNVDELIAKTVANPRKVNVANTPQQEAKQQKAELRRKYLAEAFRNEEQRLLEQEEHLKRRQEKLEKERESEIAALSEPRSSDLTVPTLQSMLDMPLMRQRAPEEIEILKLKRKHNREMLRLRAQERKLDDLLKLYYVTDEFIVSEKDFLKRIDEVFASESSEALRTKLSVGASRPKTKNEKNIGDALFGSVGGGDHVGLPVIEEFLSGEMKTFADDIEAKSKALLDQKKRDLESIL